MSRFLLEKPKINNAQEYDNLMHQWGSESNGLENLIFLTKKEIKDKEPALDVKQTLWVPQTGIVDYKNINLLRRYMTEKGKILPSRVTQVSTKKQMKTTYF